MDTDKKSLELQLKYISDDIEEVERSIHTCHLTLATYQKVLEQLKADREFVKSKLEN